MPDTKQIDLFTNDKTFDPHETKYPQHTYHVTDGVKTVHVIYNQDNIEPTKRFISAKWEIFHDQDTCEFYYSKRTKLLQTLMSVYKGYDKGEIKKSLVFYPKEKSTT